MRTRQVGEAFYLGKSAKGSSVRSTGDKLYSYDTVILQHLPNRSIIGNMTKYSRTTSRHQSQCILLGKGDIMVTDVPRGTTNLIPYIDCLI